LTKVISWLSGVQEDVYSLTEMIAGDCVINNKPGAESRVQSSHGRQTLDYSFCSTISSTQMISVRFLTAPVHHTAPTTIDRPQGFGYNAPYANSIRFKLKMQDKKTSN